MIKRIFGVIGILFSISILGFVFLGGCSSLGTKPSEQDYERLAKSKNFDTENKIFLNRDRDAFKRMDERPKFKGGGGFFKFLFGSDPGAKPENGLPVLKPKLAEFMQPSEELKIIWCGHSTFMVNLHGNIILVDPIISNYASPVFFLMTRFQKSPFTLDELPPIDYILISHDHYDHLDMPTIKYFTNKKQTKFIVPLGVGSHLRGWGVENNRIEELDWWDISKRGEIEFIATPAQHFSGRSLNDRNSTLWAGWIIKSDKKRIFFSGDSGYDSHFKDIGDKYGPFDLVLLDNGQYNPAWQEVHLLPEQGIKAFQEVKGDVFLPVHWGVFKLSTHTWYDPARKAYRYSVERHIPIIIPKIGELVYVSKDYETKQWWEELIEKVEK